MSNAHGIPTSGKRLAKWQGNPALRSKLPDASLTAAELHARHIAATMRGEDLDPLYSPTAVLTGHELASAAAQEAAQEINPQEAAYDQQARVTKANTQALLGNVAAMYGGQLAANEAQAQAQAKAIGDDLNARTAAANAQQATIDQSQNATDQAAQAQDATLRGAGLQGDANQRIATTAQLAAQTAGTEAAGGSRLAAQTAANNQAYTNALAASVQQQGGQTAGQLATQGSAQLSDIAAKKAAVEATRGTATTKDLLGLREQMFDNQATLGGLNLDQSKLQQTALDDQNNYALAIKRAAAADAKAKRDAAEQKRHDEVSEGTAAQNADTDLRNAELAGAKFKSDQEKDAYLRLHGLGPYKPSKAPTSKQSAHSQSLNTAIGNALLKYDGGLKHGQTLSQIAQGLRKQGAPNMVLDAAADLASFGHILPAHVALLEAAGVMVPAQWKK